MTIDRTDVGSALRRALLLAVLLWAGFFTNAKADGDLVPYTVKAGETLSELAQRYLVPPPDLGRIQTLNALVDVDRLREGEVIRFPRRTLKHSPSMATVVKIECQQPIAFGRRILREGDLIGEGDTLTIPRSCGVRLALEDGSTVRVPAGGRLQINLLRNNPLDNSPVIRMQIAGGHVEVNVNEQIKRTAPFEVSTPTAVMGVRGTSFRVGHIESEENSTLEVLSGEVGLSAGQDAPDQRRLVTAGRGIVLDGRGGVMADEALLPPSRLVVAERTDDYWLLKIDSDEIAAKHWILETSLASFINAGSPRAEKGGRFWIHRPTAKASFIELVPESAAGLRGFPAQYGLCESEQGKCDVWFESPLPEAMSAQISIRQLQAEPPLTVVIKQDGRRNKGKFLLRGLPAGQYEWSVIEADAAGRLRQSAQRLEKKGQFHLMAIPKS